MKLSAVGYQPSAAGGRLRGSFTPNSLVILDGPRLRAPVHSPNLRVLSADVRAVDSFVAAAFAAARWPASRSSLPLGFGAASATRAKAGGEYRARTGDLLVANQALSQLS